MKATWTYWLMMAVVGALLMACASIGSPEGGPRDYTPPQVTKTSPAPGSLNFKGQKVEITFDEIINLKDQQKKVIVSPAPKSQPLIRTVGKKVTVEFREPLEENTTYVIDFSNAIEDNNESNQLDGYAFAFSTGDEIDTLAVSGIVLRASDLEPMQHVIVGLHSNLEDSAFTRVPLERVSRTNDRGKFTILGLKPGSYHVFAINDVDGDYRMARTEDIAFLDKIIVPSTSEYTSSDTIFTFDRKVDSVMTGTHTLFLPNDLLLCMFNEGYRSHYIKQTSRPADNKLYMLFGAPNDTLPTLDVIRPAQHQPDWYRVERTADNDSLFYWITDSAMIKTDTIIVAMTYLRTDTADRLQQATDTIRFGYRKPAAQVKEEEKKAKEREERAKRLAQLLEKQEKAAAQGKELNEGELDELKELQRVDPNETPKLNMDLAKSGTIDVGDSIILKFDVPIASIDPGGVHLEMKRDTLWVPYSGTTPPLRLVDDCNPMRYWLPVTTLPDSTYRITIDSAAVASVYGLCNDRLSKELKVRGLEQYANVYFHVNVKDSAFVELLASGEKVIRTVPVKNNAFELINVTPGTYYLRLTIDSNGNGKWDTGNYASHLQPEEVYYYPKKLRLRANWDLDENWNIYETALDLQKPDDIRHNKPEQAKNKVEKKQDKSSGDEDEEEDEFGTGISNASYTGNKYNDAKNNRNNRRLNR
ncbi:MAG: Ig-like domain-containing protein [Muribaculaceae bacterium]|nr:Ig-like domain-containing protein [Muribaculaceae bacterium]